MRAARPLFVLMLLIASTGPVHAAETEPGVIITEVHPRPATDGREFIELQNTGNGTINLDGWTLTDSTNGSNLFTFDAWELVPGAYVIVWGGGNASSLGPVWKANVWNNGGDQVVLRDDQGITMDAMEYGTVDVPAPAEGVSLHWNGDWVTGEQTPGQDMHATTGSATATVEDLPPEVTWVEAPATVTPGQNVSVTFTVEDANGDEVGWAMDAGGVEVGNGTTAGTHTVQAQAPASAGTWTWTLTATSTDQQTVAALDLKVSNGTFRVILPEEGILLDGLVPGATDVQAEQTFQIINTGSAPATPYLDMSDFRHSEGVIPVAGNLDVITQLPDGSQQIIQYDGPLQPLPELQPAESLQVAFAIQQVPTPLAAGEYRSTFAVVA